MSVSVFLMWLLMMLGLYTPTCDSISMDKAGVCSDTAQPQPMHVTNDISNGI